MSLEVPEADDVLQGRRHARHGDVLAVWQSGVNEKHEDVFVLEVPDWRKLDDLPILDLITAGRRGAPTHEIETHVLNRRRLVQLFGEDLHWFLAERPGYKLTVELSGLWGFNNIPDSTNKRAEEWEICRIAYRGDTAVGTHLPESVTRSLLHGGKKGCFYGSLESDGPLDVPPAMRGRKNLAWFYVWMHTLKMKNRVDGSVPARQ